MSTTCRPNPKAPSLWPAKPETRSTPLTGYRISSQGIDSFFKVNPGSYVRLVRLLNPATPSYLCSSLAVALPS